jgi:bifunctional UDP-N-acetylglucosamine pyrophosphorylase / glucosamine-1-phosphate N-acetyltransferase
MRRVGVVVLAAGKGTRMRSRYPKVTHRVGGRPMLEHVLRAAANAVALDPAEASDPGDGEDHSPAHVVIVVGHERDVVRQAISWSPPGASLTYVVQEPQRGTGDAVRAAHAAFAGERSPDTLLVLYGDTPLVRAETLRDLLAEHARTGATLTFLTGLASVPTDYGRVLRDSQGRVRGIVEKKHATPAELAIPEVNSGIYCFEASWLWPRLDSLVPHDNGEYYLTDLIGTAIAEGRAVATAQVALEETIGVNDRIHLAEAEAILRRRILHELLLSGVTIEDPATTYVEAGVVVGQDTILRPGTMLHGRTVIGAECVIGPNSVVRDSQIGDNCEVLASWLDGAVMEAGTYIGPMSRLRPGAHLQTGARLGNFAEVKNATIGQNVQMHHFSYVGDANVGAGTNIGAGTITCNWDGKRKNHTEIGEHVFIGSDTLFVAPVTVGDSAATGAGSVVTHDVAPGKLVAGVPARAIRRVRRPDDSASSTAASVAPAHPPEPPTLGEPDRSAEAGLSSMASRAGEGE